jgi:hypothetical protein
MREMASPEHDRRSKEAAQSGIDEKHNGLFFKHVQWLRRRCFSEES